MKAKKLRRVIWSVALSAALLAEPLAGMPAVYAEEIGIEDTEATRVSEEETESEETVVEQEAETESPETVVETETESQKTVANTKTENSGTVAEQKTETAETATEEESVAEDGTKNQEVSDGFSLMPDDYELTDEQMAEKEGLSDTLEDMKDCEEGKDYVKGEVVCMVSSQEEAEMVAEAYNAEIVEYDAGILTMQLSEGQSVVSAVETAADTDNNLPAVSPNYYMELLEDDSDTEVSLETLDDEGYEAAVASLDVSLDPYLDSSSSYYQWFHRAIYTPFVWNAGYTGKSIRVGIADTGVDSNSDLTVTGAWNFCEGEKATYAVTKHGTHVAGIVAARANGSMGEGVAPDVELYNARVYNKNYECTTAELARAIRYMAGEEDKENPVAQRVDIINISAGVESDVESLRTAVQEAYEKGVVIVAAAGNDGKDSCLYPAAYDGVIAVGSVNQNMEKASSSDYGSRVDVYAPGVNIYSTTWNAGYEALSGTSMACPVVTGEVALILSAANQGMEKFSNLKTETGKAKVDAVKQILKDAATIEVTYGDKTMPAKMTNFAQVFNLSIADGQTVPDEPTISITPVKDTEDASAKVQVTITVPNNTVVYYTTNGSDPTYSNSEAVSDEIVETTEDPTTKKITGTTKTFTLETADGTGVVKAVAVNGTIASAVAEESFDLGLDDSENTIAAPEITITPAENERSASVKIKSASGTTIYYTTDGTTPVFDASNGKAQESTVKVNANKASFSVEYDASTRGGTIKAIAVSNTSGGSKSAVASETYTLSPDLYYPSLTATAASGKQSATVKITRRESYTNLYYTIDGSDPTVNSTPITSGTEFTVHASDGNAAGIVTIKAIAYDDRDKRVSDVKTKTIQLAVTPTTPTITVSKASNNQSATVTIKNADPGVGIYYTIDGTTPTASGKKYSSALTVKYSDTQNGSCTVKAIAVNANSGKSSSMASTSLTLTSSSSSSGGSGSGSASGSSGSGSSSGGSSSSGSSSGGSGSSGSSSDAGTSSGTPAANATISDTNPVTTITVAKSSPKTGIITKDNPNPTIDLSSQVSVKTKDKTSVAGSALGSSVTWTSSKPSVATVDAKGLVTMKSAGKTKITIKSTDKKHKKTTITITVKQAVTSIEATTKDGQSGSTFTVAPGKSLTMKVTLNGSVSKPTNKKLKWTINSSDSNVKINKSTGKITVKKKASPGTYTVTATAADGKGATMTKTIVIQ